VPEWASTIIVVLVLLLILFGMWQGWRALVRRSAHLQPSHDVPASLGAPALVSGVLYVATTAHGKPLERLAIRGLGFRAHGTLAVHTDSAEAGLVVALDGAEDVWVPASAIIDAQPAQVVIDKAVEKDGLVALSWAIGETAPTTIVDSYFRVTEPEKTRALYDAIDSITTPIAAPTAESEA